MSNHIIELKAYNPPKAVESRQDDWVKFGEKNDYYQFLIDRYNNSTTNNQVINNIVKLIFGKGLDARDAGRKPSEYAQMKMLFSKDVTKKAITDMYLLGQCALQVIYSKNKKTIVEVQHMPVNLLRPQKCNEDGVIENYYYSYNWANLREFPPVLIPSFGNGDRTLEILMISNYTIGQKYFSSVSYIGGLGYAKLEEDIQEYLISLVETGFTPLKIINFNNGVPSEDLQRTINDSVIDQTTGASGKKLIVSFNSDETKKTTVDSIGLDNAAGQYEYLSNESRSKILLSHGVTSGLLFGIPSANGFSSNADELKTAFVLFDNNVIIPNQEQFCDGIDKILAYNKISLDLTFKPLKSLDDSTEASATAESNKVVIAVNAMSPLVANKVLESMTPDEIRNLIGLPPTAGGSTLDTSNITQMSSIDIDPTSFASDLDLDEWELVDSMEVDYENEDANDKLIYKANNPSLLSKIKHFASTGSAYPRRASEQDTKLFKTRYRYSGNSNPEREFCKKMMSANKLYRKEDIVGDNYPSTLGGMSALTVNPGFGMRPNPNEPYDVFLWKGGGLLSEEFPKGTCKHFWVRETYRRKGTDILSPLAQKVTPSEARKEGEILPTNDPRVYKAPHDMR